jgi:hypothetical protein
MASTQLQGQTVASTHPRSPPRSAASPSASHAPSTELLQAANGSLLLLGAGCVYSMSSGISREGVAGT